MEVTRFGGVAACALAANAVGVDEAPSGDVRGRVRESSGVRRAACGARVGVRVERAGGCDELG
jgi:hypothetical protein